MSGDKLDNYLVWLMAIGLTCMVLVASCGVVIMAKTTYDKVVGVEKCQAK